MPIHALIDRDHGLLIQRCANCGARHAISMNRASLKARTGALQLRDGDTLEIRVDVGKPALVTFHAADFPDLAAVSAAQLATVLQARLPGVLASDDEGGLLVESATAGEASELEVVGGSACAALGLAPGTRARRPELGQQLGDHVDANILELRRCSDCGAREFLVRTDDALDAIHANTLFAAHRHAVNALAEHAIASAWSHPSVAAAHVAAREQRGTLPTTFPSYGQIHPTPHAGQN